MTHISLEEVLDIDKEAAIDCTVREPACGACSIGGAMATGRAGESIVVDVTSGRDTKC